LQRAAAVAAADFQEIDMLEFNVPDMHSAHCIAAITKAVQAADHNALIEFDLPAHIMRVTNVQDVACIEGAVRDAGYTPHLTQA
jgi:copper chaperone